MDQYTNQMNPGGGITFCMGCAKEYPGGGPGATFCPECADKLRKEHAEAEALKEPQSYSSNDVPDVPSDGFSQA